MRLTPRGFGSVAGARLLRAAGALWRAMAALDSRWRRPAAVSGKSCSAIKENEKVIKLFSCKTIASQLCSSFVIHQQVAWPSGLRRWFKAPVSSEAWVRIPPLSNTNFTPSLQLFSTQLFNPVLCKRARVILVCRE